MNDHIQRPPAEVRYADELARLRDNDDDARPPGWALSLRAARRFVIGDEKLGVSRKFVGDPSLIDRALVTLATNRGLMLVGEPGTAKSLLSELLAAAVSGTSTLTIQGGAATTEDQIKYSWNYALLVAEGPRPGRWWPPRCCAAWPRARWCASRRSPAARSKCRTACCRRCPTGSWRSPS